MCSETPGQTEKKLTPCNSEYSIKLPFLLTKKPGMHYLFPFPHFNAQTTINLRRICRLQSHRREKLGSPSRKQVSLQKTKTPKSITEVMDIRVRALRPWTLLKNVNIFERSVATQLKEFPDIIIATFQLNWWITWFSRRFSRLISLKRNAKTYGVDLLVLSVRTRSDEYMFPRTKKGPYISHRLKRNA